MTDKEIKHLSRSQLIEIIYQLQLELEVLERENRNLKKELEDRRIRMLRAGNIAEAALEIQNVMQAAQNAADLYLEEIRVMRKETQERCQRLLENARKEADSIAVREKPEQSSFEATLETIMREFGQK